MSEVKCHSQKWYPGYEPELRGFCGGKTFIHVSCKYVLDLIFVDIRNADDSDTEVVINQHDQGSRRCLTKRDELGQGDIYIVKKGGSGTKYVEIS